MNQPNSLQDQPNSFGWISISLHWLTAIIITALWVLGKSIEFQTVETIDARRSLHVTIGLIAWLLLAARIGWRVRNSHPRATGQSDLTHRLAQLAHYLMLGLLALMLLSGPLLAWSFSGQSALAGLTHAVHATTANLLAALVLLHVLAALKHLMFNDDETIARIFVPRRTGADTPDKVEP